MRSGEHGGVKGLVIGRATAELRRRGVAVADLIVQRHDRVLVECALLAGVGRPLIEERVLVRVLGAGVGGQRRRRRRRRCGSARRRRRGDAAGHQTAEEVVARRSHQYRVCHPKSHWSKFWSFPSSFIRLLLFFRS